jgi:hypothetical protein
LGGVSASGSGHVLVRGASAAVLDGVSQDGGGLSGSVPPPPPERIVSIPAEARSATVPALPARTATAFADPRRITAPAESRTYVVEALNRVVYASEDTGT